MVSDMCRGFSRERAFSHALRRCREEEVADLLGGYARHDPVPGLDALECTHAALTCFMGSRTFEEAVVHAVNLGGDADTVGACCGALSGAYYGSDAIPAGWRSRLQDEAALSDLAFRLWVAAKAQIR
jgi:ADP-ribosyl-[dinitrogen reductase] hydrolase